jgi:hypothetical protein
LIYFPDSFERKKNTYLYEFDDIRERKKKEIKNILY